MYKRFPIINKIPFYVFGKPQNIKHLIFTYHVSGYFLWVTIYFITTMHSLFHLLSYWISHNHVLYTDRHARTIYNLMWEKLSFFRRQTLIVVSPKFLLTKTNRNIFISLQKIWYTVMLMRFFTTVCTYLI